MYSQVECSLVGFTVGGSSQDDMISLTLINLADILTIIACGALRVCVTGERADRTANVNSDAFRFLVHSSSTVHALLDPTLCSNTCRST